MERGSEGGREEGFGLEESWKLLRRKLHVADVKSKWLPWKRLLSSVNLLAAESRQSNAVLLISKSFPVVC